MSSESKSGSSPHQTVRKAVIPVAGLGTRFLPATKVVAKELLPIVDRPTIHYIVEEAYQSGIEQIIFVSAAGKSAIEDYFDRSFGLEKWLEEKGDTARLELVREISQMVEVQSVRQKTALGLGHAIGCARGVVGNEPFAVLLGDDMFDGDPPATRQLIDAYERCGRAVVGVYEVPVETTHRYGIVDCASSDAEPYPLRAMVEKPRSNPPSNLAIIGRYILPPEIFDCIDATPRGASGEIQITDALNILNAREGGGVFAQVLRGARHDAGDIFGFIEANIAYALKRPELADRLRELLARFAAS
ncbi:MAG: UTP--glucose-1-phosphate uridylyltransferase [Deltaproteobacteria bacterium]|nr:UTP--glucose-1-phosphate uridylyltransferase [Deltaproteobacteria bacterium]